MNIKIFDLNNWDTETLATSPFTISGFPANNTQHRWKTKTWKHTGVTSAWIRTEGGSSIISSGFFIFFHNITATGTVSIYGSDNLWVSSTLIGTMSRSADCLTYIPPSNTIYDDYMFIATDTNNLDGYIKYGRVWLGEYYEPRVGYNPDNQVKNPDPSIKLPSTGGQISILEREKYHTWLFPFDCIYDKARYDTFIDRVGTSKEFVILKQPKGYLGADYPDPEDNSFYVSMPSHDEKPKAGDKYTAILKLQEER